MLVLLIGGMALAGGTFAYGASAAKSQLFGRTFFAGDPARKRIALTYDDGPNDVHTERLLEVLARHGARATFFMIGKYVQARPQIARRVAEAGHEIGNHTTTHPNLIFLGADGLRRELEDCERALSDAVGPHARLFRPPFGARRPATLRIARAMGLSPVMWSVKCWDWKEPAERIEAHAVRQMHAGAVVLLHDGGHLALGTDRSATVAATERILRRYKEDGWEFVSVGEMMKDMLSRQSSVVS
jgi:peptidoglycan-N-acetylglucosamine deacetylase